MESIQVNAKVIVASLLPDKSKEKYLQVYSAFMQWKKDKQLEENNFLEETILVYFDYLHGK